jgi:hypothetical protein
LIFMGAKLTWSFSGDLIGGHRLAVDADQGASVEPTENRHGDPAG